jgi:drug/metabolite transporter (DMT)-like permease
MVYTALKHSPVSVVTPLVATVALFTLIFSFLLNRDLEVFTWKVLIGAGVTIAGTFLLFL